MTEGYVVTPQSHPLHTLVSWPAVLAGAAIAVTVGFMLNLLGAALGAGTFDTFELARAGDAGPFKAAAGLWVAVANAVALFAGAAAASRAAKYPDHHNGMLHGLSVWAVAFFIAIMIATAAGGGAASSMAGPGEDAMTSDIGAPAPTGVLQSNGAYLQADGTVTSADGAVIGSQSPTAATAAPLTTAPITPPVTPTAPKVADPAAAIAFWGFLGMLFGAIGAVLGGRYGARHHKWETRLATKETVVRTTPPPAI